MILQTNPIKNTIYGNCIDTSQFTIDAKHFSHIANLLSKKMYSNPIKTIMTEYVQNALDTHRNIHSNKKIKIILPSQTFLWYIVQDFGEGMSKNFILNNLIKYGMSTKTQTNKLYGGFGIGFKASAIYCDNFTMIVNYNNIKYVYDVTNHEGSGNITLLYEEPTNECNGTTIKIPVNINDVTKFNQIYNDGIYQLLYDKIDVYQYINSECKKLSIKNEFININEYTYININKLVYTYTTPRMRLFNDNIFINSINDEDINNISKIIKTSSKLYFNDDDINILNEYYNIIHKILYCYSFYNSNVFECIINIPIGKFDLNVNRETFDKNDNFYVFIIKQLIDIVKWMINQQNKILVDIQKLFSMPEILKKLNHLFFVDDLIYKQVAIIIYNGYKEYFNEQYKDQILSTIKTYISKSCYNFKNILFSNKNFLNFLYNENALFFKQKVIYNNIYFTNKLLFIDFKNQQTKNDNHYNNENNLSEINSIIITKNRYINFNNLKSSIQKMKEYGDMCLCVIPKSENTDIIYKVLKNIFPTIPVIYDIKEQKIEENNLNAIGYIDNHYFRTTSSLNICDQYYKPLSLCNVLKKYNKYKFIICRLPKNVSYNYDDIKIYLNELLNKKCDKLQFTSLYHYFAYNNFNIIFIPYDYTIKNFNITEINLNDIINEICPEKLKNTTLINILTIIDKYINVAFTKKEYIEYIFKKIYYKLYPRKKIVDFKFEIQYNIVLKFLLHGKQYYKNILNENENKQVHYYSSLIFYLKNINYLNEKLFYKIIDKFFELKYE